jgi:hypothetical protein
MPEIFNPTSGEKRMVSGATLGVWRRRGWILVKENSDAKKHLRVMQESVVVDEIPTPNEEA